MGRFLLPLNFGGKNKMPEAAWPEFPRSWQDTRDTLHRMLQIVGKVRLKLSPPEPEFGHVALYVTARGLTTSSMRCGNFEVQIDFDFIAHQLVIQTSDGAVRNLALTPRAVADFYSEFQALLSEMSIPVTINPIPQEVADQTPFDQDRHHASYDADSVHRFWQILGRVDTIFKKHRAPFRGRHTPVNFFWGGLDICYDRFSGRAAAPPPGANWLLRKSMDAEQIYVGFWPGDARFPEAAFASYVYPKPEGIENAAIRPSSASWNAQLGEFIWSYDDMRKSESPNNALRDFLKSTYEVSADLAHWDRKSLG
jgi:Family of unknown function (DUF5996)